MAITVFEDQYLTNIKEIDDHHIRLIELSNVLLAATKTGKGREKAGEVLAELTEYAQYHFRVEEAYLRKLQDKNYQAHCESHRYFIEQLANLKGSVVAQELMAANQMLRFLVNWLLKHILEQDKLALTGKL